MARLGDLYKITSGGTPSRKHLEYYQNGTIPWVKTGDLKEKYLWTTDEKITEIGLKNSSARIYPQDTVLIAMYGATIGASSILKIEAATNQACAAFVKRDDIIPEYLYAFLESQQSRFIKDAVGGAQPNISAGYLKKIEIPIPPLEEQRRIATLLDKVSDLIAKRRAQLDKLDLLVKSRFVEMFYRTAEEKKWPIVRMSDISTYMRTGPFGSALHHDEFVNKGVFVLGIDNAVENRFSYNRMRYITEEKYQQLKRYTVKPGDVIITIMGTVGRSAVIPNDMPKAINTKHLACLTIDREQALPDFVCCAFQMHPGIREQLTGQAKGAIMDGLNLTIIKRLEFNLPPLLLQSAFVIFYKKVSSERCRIVNSLDKLELLKKALMQQYFETRNKEI